MVNRYTRNESAGEALWYLSGTVMYDIITGIVIGAIAGLVTVVITGLWSMYSRWQHRQEQITFIREFVFVTLIFETYSIASVWHCHTEQHG